MSNPPALRRHTRPALANQSPSTRRATPSRASPSRRGRCFWAEARVQGPRARLPERWLLLSCPPQPSPRAGGAIARCAAPPNPPRRPSCVCSLAHDAHAARVQSERSGTCCGAPPSPPPPPSPSQPNLLPPTAGHAGPPARSCARPAAARATGGEQGRRPRAGARAPLLPQVNAHALAAEAAAEFRRAAPPLPSPLRGALPRSVPPRRLRRRPGELNGPTWYRNRRPTKAPRSDADGPHQSKARPGSATAPFCGRRAQECAFRETGDSCLASTPGCPQTGPRLA